MKNILWSHWTMSRTHFLIFNYSSIYQYHRLHPYLHAVEKRFNGASINLLQPQCMNIVWTFNTLTFLCQVHKIYWLKRTTTRTKSSIIFSTQNTFWIHLKPTYVLYIWNYTANFPHIVADVDDWNGRVCLFEFKAKHDSP